MNKGQNKVKSKDAGDFTCDNCKTLFHVGDGFMGSLDDFEFQISDKSKIKDQEIFECSPFMNFVQLCKKCYNKEK